MLVSLFMVGTYPFWILVVLVSFFLFACVEKLWAGWATVALFTAVSIVCLTNDMNPLTYAQENPFVVLRWVLLYTIIGTAWSTYRWYVFLLKRRDEIKKVKLGFLRVRHIEGEVLPEALKEEWLFVLWAHAPTIGQHNPPHENRNQEKRNDAILTFLRNNGRNVRNEQGVIPDDLKDDWAKEVQRISREVQFTMRPRPRDHKGQITLWMIYWPWSLAWYVLNDPIKRFANWIYRRIQQILEAISEHVWKDVKNDLPPTDI